MKTLAELEKEAARLRDLAASPSRIVECTCGHIWNSCYRNARWERCPKCQDFCYRWGRRPSEVKL